MKSIQNRNFVRMHWKVTPFMCAAGEARNVLQQKAYGGDSFDRLLRIRTKIVQVFWELKSYALSKKKFLDLKHTVWHKVHRDVKYTKITAATSCYSWAKLVYIKHVLFNLNNSKKLKYRYKLNFFSHTWTGSSPSNVKFSVRHIQ